MKNKKNGEKERKGLETRIKYKINEKLQKRLKEEGKKATEIQENTIYIFDENLKKKVYINTDGNCKLDLTHLEVPTALERWERDDLGLRKYKYKVENKYEYVRFDRLINSEKDIINYIERKRKEAIEEMQRSQNEADIDYERRRKEAEERLRKEVEEKERKRKEEEERKKMLNSISWLRELKTELEKRTATDMEIERFCKKFEIPKTMIKTYTISDAPFVSISTEIDLGDFELKIYNYIFGEYNDEYGNEWTVHFSDKRRLIAEILSKIFKGKVVEVAQEHDVYLNVVTENDTINIASSEKRYDDY